ncbi:50S ribosomal protein L3 N(5)-glutamine methyltransferase [Opitutus sp. GAS368]|jgi:ribosomal protein L3 glutamine methyltransferase|uniref:50S ribosomal protein L3 N(5)-glutamine methyltransferase n=1 Tax=Opitutus sp. GAS368 TaxID=1882749 RepID=UPI00087C53FB|nr:50S ribosomal protein L3 N(5)-glutamine methyltransferase [Opitutus sp. GAS368]SDR98380.1 [LSU ribosomal protein L3P]-glutamine N5-methyltransferase [Opitutus sp. GAS368]
MSRAAIATPGDRPSPRLRPGKRATLGDWLRWGEKLYAKHRVAFGQVATNAHDEALYLLLHTLNLPLDSKPAVLRRKLTPEEEVRVKEIFRRRTEDHVPAAYLTREAFLGEHRFYVDERVIIPRSYFLELLPEQIPQWLPPGKPVKRAVDVCTGSGCLAILLAHRFAEARVDAIELSPDALAVAKFNVARHHLAPRVKLFHSDVFDAVPAVKYDLILSNPPYVPTRELRGLSAEFKQEPAMALDGGKDGLDIIRKLLRQARERLQPHGVVVLEVGGLRAAMDRAFPELDLHWLHTEDGEDCVCLMQATRLARWGHRNL